VGSLEIQKLTGFNRIYQAGCFPDEVKSMFGKNTSDYQSAIVRAERIFAELED